MQNQNMQEEAEFVINTFQPVWDKQGMQHANGYVYPNELTIFDAIEQKRAKKIIDIVRDMKMLAGDGGWRDELVRFRDGALAGMRNEDEKERLVKNFQETLNGIDWNATLIDSMENPHSLVAKTEAQVVTQSGGSYFVWNAATGDCMIQGCESLIMLGQF